MEAKNEGLGSKPVGFGTRIKAFWGVEGLLRLGILWMVTAEIGGV